LRFIFKEDKELSELEKKNLSKSQISEEKSRLSAFRKYEFIKYNMTAFIFDRACEFFSFSLQKMFYS